MASEYGDLSSAFPIAEKITLNSFFLGTFIGISDEKMEYTSQAVEQFFSEELKKKTLKVIP
jgi:hypothetical protein